MNETSKNFRERQKERLAALRAEAAECAAAGVEMDRDSAAELELILQAKKKQADQTKFHKHMNEAQYKETRKRIYEEHRDKILQKAKRKREEERQIASGGSSSGRRGVALRRVGRLSRLLQPGHMSNSWGRQRQTTGVVVERNENRRRPTMGGCCG
jgi:hypothetical protein